jgi:ABC-type dipeptide/oligopeptide/nickel transport system ATPase component
MYAGKLAELAGSESINRIPRHPYTAALMGAAPAPWVDAARSSR